MNRSRPKQILIRASETEFEQIKKKIDQSDLSQNEYLLKTVLDKDIVVIEGIKELTVELKRIGNNLNQLTKSVHEGKVNCSYELEQINKDMKEVWHYLRKVMS